MSHEQIDAWQNTVKGPAKLAEVVRAEAEPLALRAHAAESLLVIGQAEALWQALRALSPAVRLALVTPLTERVWQRARVAGADDVPTASQVAAKDWLVTLRDMGSVTNAAAIDQYLLDWYAQPSLEARATLGDHPAIAVMHALGEGAGPRMRGTLGALLARPMARNTYARIGDELMAAVAATREPEALRQVWNTGQAQRGDPTLARRAIVSLSRGLAPGIADAAVGEAVAVLRAELAAVARGDLAGSDSVRGVAIALLAGLPANVCVTAMSDLVVPLRQSELAWHVAGYMAQCAAIAAGKRDNAALGAAAAAVAKAPRPATRGAMPWLPPVAVLGALAAHGDVDLRWLAVEFAGVCVASLSEPARAACAELLRGRAQDTAPVKLLTRQVSVSKRAAELLAAAAQGAAAP